MTEEELEAAIAPNPDRRAPYPKPSPTRPSQRPQKPKKCLPLRLASDIIARFRQQGPG